MKASKAADQRQDAETPRISIGSNNGCLDNTVCGDFKSPQDSREAAAGGRLLRGSRSHQYTFSEKLAARTVRGPSCWLICGHALPNGYVQIASGSPAKGNLVRKLAHRLAYELAVGPIPAGYVVLHTCDTPRCVNPDHLKVGTQADNIADAVSKGRYTAWHKTGIRLDGRKALRQPLSFSRQPDQPLQAVVAHATECAACSASTVSPQIGQIDTLHRAIR